MTAKRSDVYRTCDRVAVGGGYMTACYKHATPSGSGTDGAINGL